MRHKFSHEHNRSNTGALQYSILGTNQSMKPKYANIIILTHKIVYKLWHNCSSDGHNNEYNR